MKKTKDEIKKLLVKNAIVAIEYEIGEDFNMGDQEATEEVLMAYNLCGEGRQIDLENLKWTIKNREAFIRQVLGLK